MTIDAALLELVNQANTQGAWFHLDGEQVVVQGPRPLPDDLMAKLRGCKQAILDLLANQGGLLSWAARLVESASGLPTPVTYVEVPLRTVTTTDVSGQAARYLRVISLSRGQQRTGGWGMFTRTWWGHCEHEALGALLALRQALTPELSGLSEEGFDGLHCG